MGAPFGRRWLGTASGLARTARGRALHSESEEVAILIRPVQSEQDERRRAVRANGCALHRRLLLARGLGSARSNSRTSFRTSGSLIASSRVPPPPFATRLPDS